MKQNLLVWLFCVALLGGLACREVSAKPRVPMPSIPEGELASWRFDGLDRRPPLRSSNTFLVEGWSGQALRVTGRAPALYAVPLVTAEGRTNLAPTLGTLRFWFAPEWTSARARGRALGGEGVLFQSGAWSDTGSEAFWTLAVTRDGNWLRLYPEGARSGREALRASISWRSGEWHEVALAWSPTSTLLYVDGQVAAKGPGLALAPATPTSGVRGFCLGSDVRGRRPALGLFDEVFSFARTCPAEEVNRKWKQKSGVAWLGPVTPAEEAKRVAAIRAARTMSPPTPRVTLLAPGCQSDGKGSGPYACKLGFPVFTNIGGSRMVKMAIMGGADNWYYDLYMTTNLTDYCDVKSSWGWQARGTNGQILMVTNPPLTRAFFMLRTRLAINVAVNNPAQDEGTLQNTQSETTLVAFSNTVVAAWVDSNLGVAGYGTADESCPSGTWYPPLSPRPQFIGWAVSHNGGVTFVDKTNPPLFTYLADGVVHARGNAGDPVLARDNANGIVYLLGNAEKPSVYYPDGSNAPTRLYLPLWRSTNHGESFQSPVNATPGLAAAYEEDTTDKPALTVDNFAGQGQGNAYLAFSDAYGRINIYRSTPGGTNWSHQISYALATSLGATLAVAANHEVHALWWQFAGFGFVKNNFYWAKSQAGGTNFSSAKRVLTLNSPSTYLGLKRSNQADPADQFRAAPLPCLVCNPVQSNHLCFVYTDCSTNALDKADIFFVQTTNGGASWDSPIRVNNDTTTNDQFQPAIAFKPDGSQIFVGWCDRREDLASNCLIRTYGAFAKLPITNAASFAGNFPISTVAFPPVFTGTLMTGTNQFDTVYPPAIRKDGVDCPTFRGNFAGHMGDYDTAVADSRFVYYSWGDNRRAVTFTTPTVLARPQADVRLARIPWPR